MVRRYGLGLTKHDIQKFNMTDSQHRGPLGSTTNPPKVDADTLVQTRSPLPGTLCVSQQGTSTQSQWGLWQIIRWKALPECLGGDRNLLKNYKDTWVRGHREHIASLANLHRIPALLLAGVAWIEVGGDPEWIDSVAYSVRAFDHVADPYLEPLTVTKRPELTSLGNVSIQLRRAAEALGLDFAAMTGHQKEALISCLSADETNLNIVAKHLSQLREIDFPDSYFWSDDQIRVVGARYNRGPSLPISSIRQNTSYGDFILKHRDHILDLLK